MLNDISLPAIAAVHTGPSFGQKIPAAGVAQSAPVAPAIINPTLRLDAALGLVVIEFRNLSGVVSSSIPSQRQLQEYRRWQATRLGPAPDGEPQPQKPKDLRSDG
jgi:hypothetical protein